MNVGIDCGENSSGGRARIIEIHGTLSNESDSQAKNIHITTISNQIKGTNNNNNNSTTFIDPNSRLQQEKHESEGETSVSVQKDKQNTIVESSKSIEATTTGNENKTQLEENLMVQQGNNRSNMRMQMQTETSSNNTNSSKFSFGIVGNSSSITPSFNAGIVQSTVHQDDQGEENGNGQLHGQAYTSQKHDQPSKELQHGVKDQRNPGSSK